MVREHLVEEANGHQRKAGHGSIRKNFVSLLEIIVFTFVNVAGPEEMLALRWNSQHGSIFVDGSHFKVRVLDFR